MNNLIYVVSALKSKTLYSCRSVERIKSTNGEFLGFCRDMRYVRCSGRGT